MHPVDELRTKFQYATDERTYGQSDYWVIMVPNDEGYYVGDCEDFALTALYLLEGSLFKFWEALLVKRAKIQFCYVQGKGHAILEYEGMYYDSDQPARCSKPQLQREGYVFVDGQFTTPQVAKRLTKGTFNKLKRE